MGNYQLKNMSLYTIICLTGLTSSQLQVPIHSKKESTTAFAYHDSRAGQKVYSVKIENLQHQKISKNTVLTLFPCFSTFPALTKGSLVGQAEGNQVGAEA